MNNRIESTFKDQSISSENSFSPHLTPVERERYRSFFRAPGMAELGWTEPQREGKQGEVEQVITRRKVMVSLK